MAGREETLAELEERERKEQESWRRQIGCSHYRSRPTEWYWSGQIREMTCDDCGLAEFRDEV